MISARLLGDLEVIVRLESLPENAAAGLGRALLRLAQELQQRARDKVSGEVLQARSGTLRSSITAAAAGLSVTIGSDLAYAAAQEYGFTGTVGVRAQLRRIKEAFGRPVAEKTIAVGGYSRQMDLPARSYLGSALAELQPAIEQAVRDALAEAIAR